MERKAIILVDGIPTQIPDSERLQGVGDMFTYTYDPTTIQSDMYLVDSHYGQLTLQEVDGEGTAASRKIGLFETHVAAGEHGHACGSGDMHTSMYDYEDPFAPGDIKSMWDRSNHHGQQELETISDSGPVAYLNVGPIQISYDANLVTTDVALGLHEHTDYLTSLPDITDIDLFDRSNHFGQITLANINGQGSAITSDFGTGPLELSPAIHDHPDFIGTIGTPTSGFAPTPQASDRKNLLRGKGDWATLQEVFDDADIEPDISDLQVFIGAGPSNDGTSGIVNAPNLTDGAAVLIGNGTWSQFNTIFSNTDVIPESKIPFFKDFYYTLGPEVGKLKAPTTNDLNSVLLGRDYEWTTLNDAIADSGVPINLDDIGTYTTLNPGLVPTPEVDGEWMLLGGLGDWVTITDAVSSASITVDSEMIPTVTTGSKGAVPEQTLSNEVLLTDGSWQSVIELLNEDAEITVDNVLVMGGALGTGLKGLVPAPRDEFAFLNADGNWQISNPPHIWAGIWNPLLTYNQYQVVRKSDGRLYHALRDGVTEITEDTLEVDWVEFAIPGLAGEGSPDGTKFSVDYISPYHKDLAFYKIRSLIRNSEPTICIKDFSRITFATEPTGTSYAPVAGLQSVDSDLIYNGNAYVLEGSGTVYGSISTTGRYILATQANFDSVIIKVNGTSVQTVTEPYGLNFLVWAVLDINQSSNWVIEYPANSTVFQVIVGLGLNPQCADRIEGFGSGLTFESDVHTTPGFPSTEPDLSNVNQLWLDGSVDTMKIKRPPPPELSVADNTVYEANGSGSFTITRSGRTNIETSVKYATAAGSAISGVDFTSVSGTAVFAIGETEKVITVPLTNDPDIEPDENLTVNLSDAVGGTIIDPLAVLTIVSEDVPTFNITAGMTVEEEVGTVSFTITRNGSDLSQGSTVAYETIGGTALSGPDYTGRSGISVFPAFVTSRSISVTIIDDDIVEGTESFTVKLSSPTNGEIEDGTATFNITNTDTPPMTLRTTAITKKTVTKSTPGYFGSVPYVTYSTIISANRTHNIALNFAMDEKYLPYLKFEAEDSWWKRYVEKYTDKNNQNKQYWDTTYSPSQLKYYAPLDSAKLERIYNKYKSDWDNELSQGKVHPDFYDWNESQYEWYDIHPKL